MFISPDFTEASHMFIRRDTSNNPLLPCYNGPFISLERSSKTLTLDTHGRRVVVIIDRVTPAFTEDSPSLRVAVIWAFRLSACKRNSVSLGQQLITILPLPKSVSRARLTLSPSSGFQT